MRVGSAGIGASRTGIQRAGIAEAGTGDGRCVASEAGCRADG